MYRHETTVLLLYTGVLHNTQDHARPPTNCTAHPPESGEGKTQSDMYIYEQISWRRRSISLQSQSFVVFPSFFGENRRVKVICLRGCTIFPCYTVNLQHGSAFQHIRQIIDPHLIIYILRGISPAQSTSCPPVGIWMTAALACMFARWDLCMIQIPNLFRNIKQFAY